MNKRLKKHVTRGGYITPLLPKNELRVQRVQDEFKRWSKKSKLEKLKWFRDEFKNSTPLQKCNGFIGKLQEKMGVKFNLKNEGLLYRRCDGKTEKEICEMSIVYKFQSKEGMISFRPHNNNTIELFEIKIDENLQNQGRGTEVLNDILDVVDSTGFNMIVTPSITSDSSDKKERIQYHYNLKEWFKSFGFKNQKFSSSMIYEPNKESLKMTG